VEEELDVYCWVTPLERLVIIVWVVIGRRLGRELICNAGRNIRVHYVVIVNENEKRQVVYRR
jgi:hypothetical protein